MPQLMPMRTTRTHSCVCMCVDIERGYVVRSINMTSNTAPKISFDLSPEAKIKNAEIMYGTGSKNHLAAIKRFGGVK